MNSNEIKDFLKNNEENNYQLGISATLKAIISILMKNNIITEEEFKKIQELCLEKARDEQIERMTDDEKKNIEVMKRFSDMFGGLV